MAQNDIRWLQRFQNFEKALLLLEEAVNLTRVRQISDLEKQGLIQRFEFTHEIAWNVLKDYFEFQGNTSITGSRDASREAFRMGLVEDGDGWMNMIKDRNRSSHTYDLEIADQIVNSVISKYCGLFNRFAIKMRSLTE